jgi:hypothetical protein
MCFLKNYIINSFFSNPKFIYIYLEKKKKKKTLNILWVSRRGENLELLTANCYNCYMLTFFFLLFIIYIHFI